MLILWCGDDSSGVQGWHQSIGHKIAKMRRLATSKHREMMDFINYPSSQLFQWNSTSIAVIWNLALFKSNHCGEQSEKARLSLYLIIAGTVIAPSLHLSLSVEPQNNLSQLHRHWWRSSRRIFGGVSSLKKHYCSLSKQTKALLRFICESNERRFFFARGRNRSPVKADPV